LVPAVPVAVRRRLGRLGDRHAEPGDLRTRIRLLELPAGARRPAAAGAALRVPQRHAAPDQRPGAPARGRPRRRPGHRSGLRLPGTRRPHAQRHPESGLLPAPGHPDVHRGGRSDLQLPGGRGLRPGRPAHPPRTRRRPVITAGVTPDTEVIGKRSEHLYFALRNPKVVIGLAIVIGLLLLGVIGPFFLQGHPNDYIGPKSEPPSSEYWMGTTYFGQDVFAQFVHGLRSSYVVGGLGSFI